MSSTGALPAHSYEKLIVAPHDMRVRFTELIRRAAAMGVGADAEDVVQDVLVVVLRRLEHIEPDLLDNVLDELSAITRKLVFLTVHTRPAKKMLSDGRNVFHGGEGDIIEGRYRIIKIGAESIEMAHLDGRGRGVPHPGQTCDVECGRDRAGR